MDPPESGGRWGRCPLSWASEVLEAGDPWSLEKGGPWPLEAQAALWPSQRGSPLCFRAALGICRRGPGSSVALHMGPHPASFTAGPATCPASLLLTLSTLYLLDEDLVGSQAETPPPAVSGEAAEKAVPLGPGPSFCVREQQPLSSLSSVLLYRTAPEDLRLVFYDEVRVCVCTRVYVCERWRRGGL